jgi:preprotein translocase subunit SecG
MRLTMMKIVSCLALLGLVLITACSAGNGSGSQNDKNSGFYGGFSGGGQP